MTVFSKDHEFDRRPQYETRIVAFLDILGFSARVMASQENRHAISEIYGVLTRKNGGISEDSVAYKFGPTVEVTVFSDTIIISEEASKCYLCNFINGVSEIQANFLSSKFPIRGAIAVGSLYHGNDVVFGPALIEAYELERSKAKFPRVILADAVFAACKIEPGSKTTGKPIQDLLKIEDLPYLDYAQNISAFARTSSRVTVRNLTDGTERDLTDRTAPIDRMIEWSQKEMDRSADAPRVYEKMEWLNVYLVGSRDQQRRKRRDLNAFLTKVEKDPELQQRVKDYFDQMRADGRLT